MRIAIVSTPSILTPPERYGGMERAVSWLVRGLHDYQKNLEIDVYCKHGSTVPGAVWGESEFDFSAVMSDAGDYDIIVDFSHDKVCTRDRPGHPQINVYQVMTMSNTTNPVFISKGQQRHIQQHHNNITGRVIYYGLDLSEYTGFNPKQRGKGGYVVFMGSMIPEKRPHWAVQAAAIAGKNIKLYGPKWDSSYWDSIDHIRTLDHAEVHDDIGGQEKIDVLANADALIHPVGGRDWVEAGAIIILESLLLGTPVITTENGCIPEYIREGVNGFLRDSPEGMAEAIGLVGDIKPMACRRSAMRYNNFRMAVDYWSAIQDVLTTGGWK